MRALVALALVVVVTVSTAEAATCSSRGYRSCGWWGWSRCSTTNYNHCVHGGWSQWGESDSSTCSKTCGSGCHSVDETRSCTNPRPSGKGAKSCSGVSKRTKIVSCNTQSCPANGGWSQWRESSRSACSKTCGRGSLTITETRSCTNPSPTGPGARTCSGTSRRTRTASCNLQACPEDGGWSDWEESSRTACSRTCGTGILTVTETRSCTNPSPSGSGARQCSGDSSRTVPAECNSQACPIHGGWSQWEESSRSACSKSCGTGNLTITETRTCTNPPPSGQGARQCSGDSSRTSFEDCNTQTCPIHGGWSQWEEVSRTECSKSCGTGNLTIIETRSCTNPPPSGQDARQCSGDSIRTSTEDCNTQTCPSVVVHGGWSQWEESGRTACSKSCGTGNLTITETRTCTNPPPSGQGARQCSGDSSRTITEDCNTQTCPIHGGWSQWEESLRTVCSKTCGTGNLTIIETRTCTNPQPSGCGARPCAGDGIRISTENCNLQPCPSVVVHGGWSQWEESGRTACSKTCETGSLTITETRTCTNPPPSGQGARQCSGDSSRTSTEDCNPQTCPTHGGWSQWEQFGRTECSKSCGTGNLTIIETRTCTNPPPSGQGARQCSGDNIRTSTADCNTQTCPTHGGWSQWEQFGRTECSKPCGTGNLTIIETRTCTNPPPSGQGARQCSGDSIRTSTEDCNTQTCPIDGGWSDWSDWDATSNCTVLCGGGEKNKTRDRTCTNPAPQDGGADCSGESRQSQAFDCNAEECGDRCPSGVDTYIAAEDTRYYYHCEQGQNNSNARAVLKKCPEETAWNQTQKMCVGSAVYTTPTTCIHGNLRVDPTDCHYYFQCSNGVEYRMICGTDQKFDTSIQTCNYADDVNC